MKFKKLCVLVPVFTMLAMFGHQIVRADTSVASAEVVTPVNGDVYLVTYTDSVATLPYVLGQSNHTATFTNTGLEAAHNLYLMISLEHYESQTYASSINFVAPANQSKQWEFTLYDGGPFAPGDYETTAETTMTVNGLGDDNTAWTDWSVVDLGGPRLGAGPGCNIHRASNAKVNRHPVAKSAFIH